MSPLGDDYTKYHGYLPNLLTFLGDFELDRERGAAAAAAAAAAA